MNWDGTGCGDSATVMSATTASISTNTCGSLWSNEEVRALIAIWGQANVQEVLDGAVRNKVVFQDISNCKSKGTIENGDRKGIQTSKRPQWRDREG